MSKEKPAVISPRVYKLHRRILRKWSGAQKVSEAEIIRRALVIYDQILTNEKEKLTN